MRISKIRNGIQVINVVENKNFIVKEKNKTHYLCKITYWFYFNLTNECPSPNLLHLEKC